MATQQPRTTEHQCFNCLAPLSRAEAISRQHVCAPDSAAMAKLPPVCYSVLLAEPCQVIALKRGEAGYYPIGAPRARAEEALLVVAELNRGLAPEQVAAMENGSMFGWHVGGASVDKMRADMARLPKLATSYAAKVSA